MNFETLYQQLVKDFSLGDLSEEDREEMLREVARTIQKQFLLDVYDRIGEAQFDALQASASMGEEFYRTTLKHVLPNYEEVFQESRKKVIETFNK